MRFTMKPMPDSETGAGLLEGPPRVINVGLEAFAEDLLGQEFEVVHVQWRPPAGGDMALARLLALLAD